MSAKKYDVKEMQEMANVFETFLSTVKSYVIIDGITSEQYQEAIKTVEKLIKKLKKGDGDKVFDQERYFELKSQGNLML